MAGAGGEHVFRAAHVGDDGFHRVLHDSLHPDRGRQVVNLVRLGNGLIQVLLLQNVRRGQGKVGIFFQMGDILKAAGAEIVISVHPAACSQQLFGQMGSHKPSPPGDQDIFHALSNLIRRNELSELF